MIATVGVFAEHVTYDNSMFEFDLFSSTPPFGVCICGGFWYLGFGVVYLLHHIYNSKFYSDLFPNSTFSTFWCSKCSFSAWRWWPSGRPAHSLPLSTPSRVRRGKVQNIQNVQNVQNGNLCKIVRNCTYKIPRALHALWGLCLRAFANLHQTPFDTKSFLSKRLLSCNGKYHRSKIWNISFTALLHNAPNSFSEKN